MPAFIVVQIEIHDPKQYELYRALAPPTLAIYGGRYLTRGGAVEALEGDWKPRRTVILEFPSLERAKAWHSSPEYAPILAIRQAAADSLMLVLEGLPEPWDPGTAPPPPQAR